MDGSDVSLTIRRAKRSGAKRLDLSHRGLSSWPDALFALENLEAIDVSGNDLRDVDPSLAKLRSLEELNLSNNKLETVPNLNMDEMSLLKSVVLDGNPAVAGVASSTLRQLERPPRSPGQTPSQVIKKLLIEMASAASGKSGGGIQAFSDGDDSDDYVPTSRATRAAPEAAAAGRHRAAPAAAASGRSGGGGGGGGIQAFSDGGDDSDDYVHTSRASKAAPEAAAAGRHRPEGRGNKAEAPPPANIDRMLAGDDGGKGAMMKEMEQLRAKVKELEGGAGGGAASGGASSVPAWLQDSRKSADLSKTLPSRMRGSMEEGDEANTKAKLEEAERKNKRLEREMQKLNERLNEKDLSKGGVGSVPHFEWGECDVGELLNQGGFSQVHKGTWHGTRVAIKKLFDPKIDEELLAEFDNEVQKLELIRHPYILMVLAVHRKPPALAIISEIVDGGSLYQLLHQKHGFSAAAGVLEDGELGNRECLQIMEGSATAIAFIHAREIIHRDIKSHNVLLSQHLDVKLCDFGLARMRSELMTGTMQFAGTPNYMSPEQFQNRRYTDRVDVFAFGTMLWESTAREIPFANLDPADIRDKVISGSMLPLPGTGATVHPVIKECWTTDQAARPSMQEILTQLRDVLSGAVRTSSRRPRTANPSGSRDADLGTRPVAGTRMQPTSFG